MFAQAPEDFQATNGVFDHDAPGVDLAGGAFLLAGKPMLLAGFGKLVGIRVEFLQAPW